MALAVTAGVASAICKPAPLAYKPLTVNTPDLAIAATELPAEFCHCVKSAD